MGKKQEYTSYGMLLLTCAQDKAALGFGEEPGQYQVFNVFYQLSRH